MRSNEARVTFALPGFVLLNMQQNPPSTRAPQTVEQMLFNALLRWPWVGIRVESNLSPAPAQGTGTFPGLLWRRGRPEKQRPTSCFYNIPNFLAKRGQPLVPRNLRQKFKAFCWQGVPKNTATGVSALRAVPAENRAGVGRTASGKPRADQHGGLQRTQVWAPLLYSERQAPGSQCSITAGPNSLQRRKSPYESTLFLSLNNNILGCFFFLSSIYF